MAKIYTKRGDQGETSLYGGQAVSKDSLWTESLGSIDELNAHLGILLAEIREGELKETLLKIQALLFTMGALLASPSNQEQQGREALLKEGTVFLEKTIDLFEGQIPPLKNFILPGGLFLGAHFHLARAICRRAERCIVALKGQTSLSKEPIIYLNRLSDLLFVMARLVNHQAGQPEEIWKEKL